MDALLLTFILGIIVCIVIYANKEKNRSSIPYVTYQHWPILGHLIPFLRDRTKFLIECKKIYGHCFRIRLINQDFILILSPADWAAVIRNSSFYFPVDLHSKRLFNIQSRILGSFKAIKIQRNILISLDHPDFNDEGHRQYVQYLKNHNGLQPLINEFVRHLHQQMLDEKMKLEKTNKTSEWISTGLLELSYRLIFESSTVALFGEVDPKSLEKDFHLFDDNFHYFSSGFPQWVYSLFFSKETRARQRLLNVWSTTEVPLRESEFIQARRQLFEQNSDWMSLRDRGGNQTGLFWGSLGNTIPALFWCLFYILRDEHAVNTIQQEIDANLPYSSLDQWTLEQLNACVYLESTINEMLRLIGAPLMTRVCDRDTQIILQDGRSFTVKSTETVAYFAPTTHLDETVFPQANQFIFDRFLNKNPNLFPGYMPFGGGKSMCPGRFFAKNEIKICLALFLRYMDYKFIDKDIIPKQKSQRVGFGVAPPDIDVAIMYRYKR